MTTDSDEQIKEIETLWNNLYRWGKEMKDPNPPAFEFRDYYADWDEGKQRSARRLFSEWIKRDDREGKQDISLMILDELPHRDCEESLQELKAILEKKWGPVAAYKLKEVNRILKAISELP